MADTFVLKAQTQKGKDIEDPYPIAVKKYKSGSLDSALMLFNHSLRIRSEKNGRKSIPVANVLTNIGAIKSSQGLYESAISYYEEALPIYLMAGEKEYRRLAIVYQNLGICFNQSDDIEKALSYYENADRIFQKLDMSENVDYEQLYLNLTQFYVDRGNLKEAEKFLAKSFGSNAAGSNNYVKWNSAAMLSLAKKDYGQSIQQLQRALQEGEKVLGANFMEKGVIYLNLGMVYREMDDYERARTHLEIASDLIESRMGKQNVNYSNCLKEIGLNFLQKTVAENEVDSFLMLRKNNIESAIDCFQKAMGAVAPDFKWNDAEENPTPEMAYDKIKMLDILKQKAEAQLLIAQITQKQGNKKEYLRELKQSLSTFAIAIKLIHIVRNGFQNHTSKLYLAENEHPVYAKATETAVRLYEITGERSFFEKGFEFSERSRNADFQSMMSNAQAMEFANIPDSLIRTDNEIKSEISSYEAFIFKEKSSPKPDQSRINDWKDRIFSLNQRYQQLTALVEKRYPAYYQYKYADPVVPLQQIQQSLDRREAFVEYFLNEEGNSETGELYTFLITSHEYRLFSHPFSKKNGEQVDWVLKFIRSGKVLESRRSSYVHFAQSAYDLYKVLIDPFESNLINYRLIIVPDGHLNYLPFDALIASPADTTRMGFAGLDYLVQHHAISYTYSGTLLYRYFRENTNAANRLGAFAPEYLSLPGDSTLEGLNLQPLPGAEAEVKGVTELIPGDQFTGKVATKEMFLKKADQYDLLHLAMHTVLNDTMPLYSKMIFSREGSGKMEERSLNTYEIYNLKLNTNLVVLSGCNTGSGKMQKGEGVMSLARGFLFAGCPSIVMSLWEVEDESGAEIMTDFYRNLRNGYTKDEALRRAKVNYIATADPLKAHPYYWLGYVSIGRQTPLFKTKAGYFAGLIIFVLLAIFAERWYFKRKRRIDRSE
ncbi:MAG: CHAT domain-containing protein [Marinilabiliales bacterium]|nr:CHAT domain-containing protein [Marinilabiliales bacterium]